jgi:hypothetical protein
VKQAVIQRLPSLREKRSEYEFHREYSQLHQQLVIERIASTSSIQNVSGSSKTLATSNSSSPDRVDLSQVAQLFKELGQLQSSNPAKFKQVLSDAASKLKEAAGQQTDSAQANFLTNLANQFQKASDSGDLSTLQPPGPPSGSHQPSQHNGAVQSATSTDSSSQLKELLELLKAFESGAGTSKISANTKT